MEWIAAILLGVVFFAIGDEGSLLHLLTGFGLGWAMFRLIDVQSRLAALERRLRERPASASAVSAAPTSAPSVVASPPPVPKPSPVPAETAARSVTPPVTASVKLTTAPKAAPEFDWRNNAIARWLLTGNVPVKVGVLVSFFGVAFLLKHAMDQGWLSLPVELRLAGVAAFGMVLLGFGWRLRASHRVYALSIQGGGIGVLYLTAYSALRLFQVLPASVVFGVMVSLTAAAGWLAVKQSARQLAVLAAVGGFLAPLLASTGSGSHVALFSYYLVLNVGIAGVAGYRHWRELNLIGFVFTFGIGLVWGAQYYREQYFASVEPFLVLHFLLYTAIAVLSALKQPYRLRGYVDSALVFGLPLVAFPLQAALVEGTRPLAWSASALLVFYAALAYGLHKRWPEILRLLTQVYVALAVIFGTLAVPLWLDGPWVSNTWALEAAAMIAIGLKQQRAFTHWAGVGLLLLATLTYLAGLHEFEHARPLLNERFIGGFMLCAAYTACTWFYSSQQVPRELPLNWFAASAAWGGWLLLGSAEILEHASNDWNLALALSYAAVLTVVLERAAARWTPAVRVLAVSLLPIATFYALGWILFKRHPFDDLGWLAWPLAFAALGWCVHALETQRRWFLPPVCWLLALCLAVEIDYGIDRLAPNSDWDSVNVLLGLLAVSLLGDRVLPRWLGETYQRLFALGPVLAAMLLYTLSWMLHAPGDFPPLSYLPVLNLMALSSIAILVAGWPFAAHVLSRNTLRASAAALALLFVTLEIARGTHHFVDVSFTFQALWHSGEFQAALSIVWSFIGIGGMVFGARRVQRTVWFAGAGLMAVVVAKLFLVDLGNTGSVTRIVSFIGVGLLLLVVGYLAPAPATAREQAAS